MRQLVKKEKAVDSWVTLKALRMSGKEAPFYVMGAVGAIMVCTPERLLIAMDIERVLIAMDIERLLLAMEII